MSSNSILLIIFSLKKKKKILSSKCSWWWTPPDSPSKYWSIPLKGPTDLFRAHPETQIHFMGLWSANHLPARPVWPLISCDDESFAPWLQVFYLAGSSEAQRHSDLKIISSSSAYIGTQNSSTLSHFPKTYSLTPYLHPMCGNVRERVSIHAHLLPQ